MIHNVQERLYAWLGGLRASDACGGLLVKLEGQGLAPQQRTKLEALRVRRHVSPACMETHENRSSIPVAVRSYPLAWQQLPHQKRLRHRQAAEDYPPGMPSIRIHAWQCWTCVFA